MAASRGTALVTGAGKRIGRAIALDLAAHGWDVAVHYRSSRGQAEAVVDEITSAGARAAAVQADLADEAQSAALIGRAAATLGPVRLLVNNAAIFEFDRPESAEAARWQRHMAVNLRAPLVLTQSLVRQLPQDADANVINLVDQRVQNLTPNYTSYTISKAGLWALTQHLAMALAPRVRVNAIGPGPVLPAPGMSEDAFARLDEAMLLGHGTSPDEICRAVRFILDAPSMTGELITLDGGFHLGWLLPKQLPEGR